MALLTKDEDDMEGMIKTLESYVNRKGLEVNADKTKIMRCRVGGRRRKIWWNLQSKEIKKVDRYNYLGYVVEANEYENEHVRERTRKEAKILRQVWGIGKRNFGKDWSRRICLFDKLVWLVVSYGVEIWEWRRTEEEDKIQQRYLR